MAELLPRYFRHQQQAEDLKRIARLILDGDEVENEAGMPLRPSADGHRSDRRRGLPVISRGIGGTAPGTDPLRALLRKEARGDLWR